MSDLAVFRGSTPPAYLDAAAAPAEPTTTVAAARPGWERTTRAAPRSALKVATDVKIPHTRSQHHASRYRTYTSQQSETSHFACAASHTPSSNAASRPRRMRNATPFGASWTFSHSPGFSRHDAAMSVQRFDGGRPPRRSGGGPAHSVSSTEDFTLLFGVSFVLTHVSYTTNIHEHVAP